MHLFKTLLPFSVLLTLCETIISFRKMGCGAIFAHVFFLSACGANALLERPRLGSALCTTRWAEQLWKADLTFFFQKNNAHGKPQSRARKAAWRRGHQPNHTPPRRAALLPRETVTNSQLQREM